MGAFTAIKSWLVVIVTLALKLPVGLIPLVALVRSRELGIECTSLLVCLRRQSHVTLEVTTRCLVGMRVADLQLLQVLFLAFHLVGRHVAGADSLLVAVMAAAVDRWHLRKQRVRPIFAS